VKNQLGLFDTLKAEPFWNARSYDFNVWSKKKLIEKLRYIHHNPAKRKLVASPELWKWSSYRFYALGEKGVVKVDPADW
jgi:putative transposase